MQNGTKSPHRRSEPRVHLIPATERLGSHKLGQASLCISDPETQVPSANTHWSSAPSSVVCLSCHSGFESLHCICHYFTPSENRATFVLTCVLSVSGGFITDSQDKGVERGFEPVAFIEHMGKAVLSAVTMYSRQHLPAF